MGFLSGWRDYISSHTIFPMSDLLLVFCWLREEVWATFPRQDESIKFAQGHADVHIFSYQDHLNGQRRFLVSTYKEFWQRLPLLFLAS